MSRPPGLARGGPLLRTFALVRSRVQVLAGSSALVAPVLACFLLQAILVGGSTGGDPGLGLMFALVLAAPLAAWAVRQALSAVPSTQADLDALAVGARWRADAAGLLAGYLVAVVMTLSSTLFGLVQARAPLERSLAVLPAAVLLAAATALAASVVGALASPHAVGGWSVPVLVAGPVLVAAAGQDPRPEVNLFVPRLLQAVEAALDGRLGAAAPGLALQVTVWSLVVLGLRFGVHRLRGRGTPTW